MKAEEFLTQEQENQVVEAIQQAEEASSGEIRVHIEASPENQVMQRAKEVFTLLKMHQTQERNAVLFYVNVQNRAFAVFADRGFYGKVTEDFWQEVRQNIAQEFSVGHYAQGLQSGILQVGQVLKKYFSRQQRTENQLPNEISKG